jgi:plastocyanin
MRPHGAPVQTQNGSIAAPTRFTDAESGFPGLGRRLWLLNPATNGTVMHVFSIDPATWGGAFTINNVSDATGSGDIDVYFYSNLGSAEFPGATDVVTLAEYDTGGPGEVGFVPAGATRAIAFTANAVKATFTYTGYSAPVIALGTDTLDVTVPAGATVVWRNATGDYSYVRHVPSTANGKRLFDSSPGTATGLRNGERFSFTFENPGTYTYETSVGTGTVTVGPGPGAGAPAT